MLIEEFFAPGDTTSWLGDPVDEPRMDVIRNLGGGPIAGDNDLESATSLARLVHAELEEFATNQSVERLTNDQISVAQRSDTSFLDMDGWYSDPEILTRLGAALAEKFAEDEPTVIVGPASSGYLLGALVAEHLGVPFIRARKNPASSSDSDRWRIRTTPPDYRDRYIRLGWRDRLVGSSDRVLAVDDLVDTGGQLLAIQAIVEDIGASWLGASVVIDNLTSHVTRRDLGVKGLVNGRDIR